ncbi:hypothetical protein DL89DRAFT_266343 [Linderina pennispora]|uniref:CHCH domain-containing protein n=1 Tax=Linderina pennispora TaxID=61395 RepID=A0A1Y1WCP7_9FUNG|nr:uncharacterized protein DL89DRAFT_266343 [Linderina pennispora]ORX71327.1 hypothetical protein DL89DRAFT_266343 [Linderina pennispora]
MSTSSAKQSLCDYEPLQQCLKANNGDRAKCTKEWDAFQQACQKRKQAEQAARGQSIPAKSECEACKAPPAN